MLYFICSSREIHQFRSVGFCLLTDSLHQLKGTLVKSSEHKHNFNTHKSHGKAGFTCDPNTVGRDRKTPWSSLAGQSVRDPVAKT